MIYTNFTDYFKALNNYLSTGGTIINGNGFAIVKNQLIPDEEYWANNSRPLYQMPNVDNPDGQNIPNEVILKKKGRGRK